MDQTVRMQVIIDKANQYTPLTEVALDPDISDNSAFLNMVRISARNWKSEHLAKMTALHFDLKIPPLDALNMIFYPPENVAAPIFLLFYLIVPRRVICHLNVCTPFRDDAYQAQWIEPFKPILQGYEPFAVQTKYPDWMEEYRHETTVFGINPLNRLDDLTQCGLEYLDAYFSRLVQCAPESDPGRLAAVSAFHDHFRNNIRTKDTARKMTAKFIGKDKSKRIFYEVAT